MDYETFFRTALPAAKQATRHVFEGLNGDKTMRSRGPLAEDHVILLGMAVRWLDACDEILTRESSPSPAQLLQIGRMMVDSNKILIDAVAWSANADKLSNAA